MKIKFTVLLLFLLFVPLVHFGQNNSPGNASDDSLATHHQPKSIRIVDINFEIERTRKSLLKLNRKLEPNPVFIQLDSLIKLEQTFIIDEAAEFKQFNPYNLSKYFLENTYRAWSGNKMRMSKWMELVNDELADVQDYSTQLDFDKKVWQLTFKNEKSVDTPASLLTKIQDIIREIERLDLKLASLRRDMIVREDNISEIIMQIDDILEEVDQLQQRQRDNLFVANNPVLWKASFSKSEILPVLPRLKKAVHENAKTIANFSSELNYLYLIFITAIVALLFFLIKRGFAALGLSKEDPNLVIVQRILSDHPYATFLSFVITLFILFYPTIPILLTGFLGIVLLICAWLFLPGMIGNQGKVIILAVFVLYVANLSEIMAWYFGSYARLYITAEALLALYVTYRFGMQGFKRVPESASPFVKRIWVLSILLFAMFSVALIANISGYMNLAVLLLKIGVKVAGIVIIVFALYAILRATIIASVEIGRHSKSAVMKHRWDGLEKRLIQMLNILAVVVLLKFVLQNMEIYRPIMDWLFEFLDHQWEIGTLRISIGGIFNLILILAISFGFANFFKVIVEDEFLVRTKLPKGVPAAISVTIRYFIIVLGLTMALSAAGIDLGSFGLLAGALGVGIGFGLQNIVNNFISGLILVYERPVNVGDTVEVENLMGIVHRIGVRSSNVRTFDGAEVVVPNGNLISNQLINWTLSDNQRRIEVKVGAAYGSDPNLILELLKQVALDHEDVLKNPEPRALFDGFGDSSLDFRLLFWVHFEMGIGTRSDIAVGIYNIFAENNIQIPFPQVDLHVIKEEEDSPTPSSTDQESKQKPADPKKTSKPGPVEDTILGDASDEVDNK